MASNLISRLLPIAGSPSVYEALRDDDESSDSTDIEERAGMELVDEENLGDDRTFELDPALADAMESQMGLRTLSTGVTSLRTPEAGQRKPRWLQRSPRIAEADEADDDVPMSLLIEDDQNESAASPQHHIIDHTGHGQPPMPILGQASGAIRAKWQATQEQQQLHGNTQTMPLQSNQASRRNRSLIVDPKEKAMWRWANVENLDNFLKDVYDYFLGNGIWCILLSRVLNLLTLAFVVTFGTFLTSCIDFSKIPTSNEMNHILISKCTSRMSSFANLLIWLFAFLWIAKVFQYILDIRRLRHMHDFYGYLLDIADTDMQTVSWQDVVKRLMALRDANPTTAANVTDRHRRFLGSQSKQRMDAHDIANRLMRRDNYLIALFNKDILDLTLPIPFLRNRPLFSKTLEWNLSLCILDYVFDERGQVRPLFLKDSHRKALSDGLRRRFMFAGFMNVLCAPFILVYFVLLYFFRYFNEYQRNPSQISSRQYTPFAEWKFREFNELWHLFERRVKMSYPFASRYIDQFPKDKTVQVSRFVAFVTGAVASVLALATVIDPEIFLGFQLTPERTVLFYLGVFGTVWAIARGVVPEENLVFDPEYALSNVTDYTHYLPSQWQGRLHSDEVRREFAQLYQVKLVIFLEELLSIILTPFILWCSLPHRSDRIIDFFREFTIHVDGLGYVCSFAVFDFKKGGTVIEGQNQTNKKGVQDLRDEYYSTKDGKMLASYYNFLDNYATNPKSGAPYLHPLRKPQFHPPPAFPGLPSLHYTEDVQQHKAASWDRPQRGTARQGLNNAGSFMQRTPRFAPTVNQASPMTSILLDPQHQPSMSILRASHKAGAQNRLRATRKLNSKLREGDPDPQVGPEMGFSESADAPPDVSDSNLGDSWKTTQAGTREEDDEGEEGVGMVTGDKSPGVLGLVYQFSRAQTEGRGTGVNI